MKRIAISIIIILIFFAAVAYASGFFTQEERYTETCVLCRAVRIHTHIYGFNFTTIRDTPMTEWYRENIDPQHGLDSAHPHEWEQSSGVMDNFPGAGTQYYSSVRIPPLFLLAPEIEVQILNNIRDHQQQIQLIHSLSTKNYQVNATRVNLLIQYYYVDRLKEPWKAWWDHNAHVFGINPSS